MNNSEWYVDWFNSPYYHLLYNNRNDAEAKLFINQLCSFLNLEKQAKVWDLACGKGRHALVLNQNKLDVIGTDLSNNSIQEAKQWENAYLHFEVHDMREAYKANYFKAVFNLFTSIGYFQNFEDNYKVFQNVAASLKEGGYFIIDFFNAHLVVQSLKPSYCELRKDIQFNIYKKIVDKHIVKRIEFKDGEQQLHFEEKVSLLYKEDFEEFAASAGLSLQHAFGNYQLESYDENKSERLILIFKNK